MHSAPVSKIGAPIIAEIPRRQSARVQRAKRIAWRIAFALADAVLILSAIAGTLVLIGAVLDWLPPIA